MGHYFENDATLKSDKRKTNIRIRNLEYTFYTDSGVFAKKGLDLGTHILLDTIPLEKWSKRCGGKYFYKRWIRKNRQTI